MFMANEIISKVLLSIENYKGDYAQFRQAVLHNDYNPKVKTYSRLLIWKTCIITETLNTREWRCKLKTCRTVYHELRNSFNTTVPWWSLEEDDEFYMPKPPSKSLPLPSEPQKSLRLRNISSNPLEESHHDSSLMGMRGFDVKDVELLHAIVLDVRRLFPDDPTFHAHCKTSLHRKRQVITLLFIWSKRNYQIGYKQGLHEILGLIFKNISNESLKLPRTNTLSRTDLDILSLYDLDYLEHDAYFLFDRFVVSNGIADLFYRSEAVLMKSIEQLNIQLIKIDQLIHYHLVTKLKLDTQLWVIRFFRLILLRELGNNLEVVSSYWDKLVAAGASSLLGTHCVPKLLTFSIIVLLIHLKAELALCDFAEALSLLLHYPISTRLNLYPDFIDSLFEDALVLFNLRGNDLKLYEYGLKLNKKYAGVIKVTSLPFINGETSRERCEDSSSKYSFVSNDPMKINMAFEKSRLETRLKKKAQLILKNKD